MRRATLATLALIAIIGQAALAQAAKPKPATAETEASAKLKELERRIASLEASRRWLLDRVPNTFAILDCNSGKYGEFLPLSGAMVLLAACEKVEPYLEGYRLTIALGNPHHATFSGLSGVIGYGEDITNTDQQQVEFPTTPRLEAGSWTRLSVVINPAAAKDLRFITIEKVSVKSASLR